MSDAFDGASKNPFREPGYRTAFAMLLLFVVVVAGLFLIASWVLQGAGNEGINTQINPSQLLSP